MKRKKVTDQSKIDSLEIEYRDLMNQAMSDNENFFNLVREANFKLDKMFTIRKKAELKAKYGKSNGYAEELKVNILD